MEILFLFLIIIFMWAFVMVGIFFYRYKLSDASANGIKNSNIFSSTFIFKLSFGKDELFKRLDLNNIYDVLDYTFDMDDMTITFSKQHFDRITYNISIKEFDGGCFLMIDRNPIIFERTVVPYFVNEFFTKKLGAERISLEENVDAFK